MNFFTSMRKKLYFSFKRKHRIIKFTSEHFQCLTQYEKQLKFIVRMNLINSLRSCCFLSFSLWYSFSLWIGIHMHTHSHVTRAKRKRDGRYWNADKTNIDDNIHYSDTLCMHAFVNWFYFFGCISVCCVMHSSLCIEQCVDCLCLHESFNIN